MSQPLVQEQDYHQKDQTNIPMPKTGTYLRPAKAKAMREEADNMERMLSNPLLAERLENASATRDRLNQVKRGLEIQSAPSLSPEQRDIAARQEQALRDEIASKMCSQEEMRKSPPGALGKYRRGEDSPDVKSKILRWKNLRLMLNPENTDPDLCNIETFRTKVSTLNMDNAFIPGKTMIMAPDSDHYRANHDRTFGNSPEVDEIKRELAALRDELAGAAKAKPVNGNGKRRAKRPQVSLPCGRAMAKQGIPAHTKTCQKCQEAQDGEA